jgi:hypothetical protein
MRPIVLCLLAMTFLGGTASGQIDPGYPDGRGWTDPTGTGTPYYCRIVGVQGNYSVVCTTPGGAEIRTAANLDPGFEGGRAWVDINKDGKTDYCRLVGSSTQPALACNLSKGNSFGPVLQSRSFPDWGYPDTRGWVGGKRTSYFCRGVGDQARPQIACIKFSITANGLAIQ